jgi:hypothetical protein
LSYPFFPALTFKEFRAKLEKEYDCTFKASPSPIIVNNVTCTISYVERPVNGKILQYSINDFVDEDMVAPSVIRSVCRRLKIDTADFGLDLG